MDMYDGQGNPVTDFDPSKGRLEMQKRIHHHEAVEAVEEQGHWETVAEYPETGGKDVQWVVDAPGVEARGGLGTRRKPTGCTSPTRRRNWRRWKRTETSLRRRSG